MQVGRSWCDMLCIICCWVYWLLGAVGPAAPLLWPALLLGVLRPRLRCHTTNATRQCPAHAQRALYALRSTLHGRQTTNRCLPFPQHQRPVVVPWLHSVCVLCLLYGMCCWWICTPWFDTISSWVTLYQSGCRMYSCGLRTILALFSVRCLVAGVGAASLCVAPTGCREG